MLAEEYRRRLESSGATSDLDFEEKRLNLALKQLKTQEDRVTDAYVAEAMDLARYKREMEQLSTQRQGLEQRFQQVQHQAREEANNREALTQLDTFCSRVAQGLDNMTFEERQQFLRLVVEGVTVAEGRITMEAEITRHQTENCVTFVVSLSNHERWFLTQPLSIIGRLSQVAPGNRLSLKLIAHRGHTGFGWLGLLQISTQAVQLTAVLFSACILAL